MPLEWKPDANPYLFSAFGILGVGPSTPPNVVAQHADQLAKQIKRGKVHSVARREISENEIRIASKSLRDDRSRAVELLMVHPQPKQERKDLKGMLEQLQQKAVLPNVQYPLSLVHPMAVFWFVPDPSPSAAQFPPFEQLNLIGATDDADLELDIVFDS